MDEGASRAGHRLQERIRSARERAFVGRIAERALFRSAIAEDAGAFCVLCVHGPGGIGKSALLSRFADDALEVGRSPVLVDGRTVDPSPEAFAAEAAKALTTSGAVLLVDTFERCLPIEDWFRREFLPQLPESAVVVVASRLAPGPQWRADLGGTEFLRMVALRNLPPDDATELLDRRGVPIALRDSVLAFAGGHPLALSLAAEVAATAATGRLPWTPGHDVLETLLSELVGAVPSAAYRHALEVCAHAYTTTQELLAAVLAAEADPAELFAWLRGLSFIESGPSGLFPHDVIRDALDADLRWRDPLGYEDARRPLIRRRVTSTNRGIRTPDAGAGGNDHPGGRHRREPPPHATDCCHDRRTGDAMTGHVTFRRVYDPVSPADGARVLVDRIWPRGLRKDSLDLTEWLRDIAPSTELRQWYNHQPERFTEFRRRYLAELATPPHRTAADHLRRIAVGTDVTLLTATRDVDRSQAAVLAHWLTETETSDQPH